MWTYLFSIIKYSCSLELIDYPVISFFDNFLWSILLNSNITRIVSIILLKKVYSDWMYLIKDVLFGDKKTILCLFVSKNYDILVTNIIIFNFNY